MSVKYIYVKNDKFLIYCMNDRTENIQPTFGYRYLCKLQKKWREVKTIILAMHLLILMETRNEPKEQHDLTLRIYVLHEITMALMKFMSYINQKFRPSYQTMNPHRLWRGSGEQLATGLVGITDQLIKCILNFFIY